MAVTSAAEARAPALPEAVQAVRTCPLPFAPESRGWRATRFLNVSGTRAAHLQEQPGPGEVSGTNRWKDWLVYPGTCRHLAISVDCAPLPSCQMRILHVPGQPPTDEERALLLWGTGGDPSDFLRPDHQSARLDAESWGARFPLVPAFGVPPLAAPGEEDTWSARASEADETAENGEAPPPRAPPPVSASAVAHPEPRWMKGGPVRQTRSRYEEPDRLPAETEPIEGLVSTGPRYVLHRADTWLSESSASEPWRRAWKVGDARLHHFTTGRRWTKQTYLVLEQPERGRSTWLLHVRDAVLLGVHRGRAWLKLPVFADPGFSLLAIDLETGRSWDVTLNASATFDVHDYDVEKTAEQGLPLQPIETNGPAPRWVSWEELDRALREAIPSILD